MCTVVCETCAHVYNGRRGLAVHRKTNISCIALQLQKQSERIQVRYMQVEPVQIEPIRIELVQQVQANFYKVFVYCIFLAETFTLFSSLYFLAEFFSEQGYNVVSLIVMIIDYYLI